MRCRNWGFENDVAHSLRLGVDASILPTIIGEHTNAAAIMIADRG
jgi:choline dehydrogenase-like flavoprotein